MVKRKNYHAISTFAIKSVIVGSYAWLAAISFGLVLLDMIYAGLVPDASTVHNEASDFLLFVNTLTALTAIGAIGSSMDIKSSRNFLTASLLIIISGFLINITPSAVSWNYSYSGQIIKVLLTGSVSILAFAGFYKYCREPLVKISYI